MDLIELNNCTFGEYYRKLRIAKGLTLRKFCLENMLDAGNHSKLERGLLPPPRDMETLLFYAQAVECSPSCINDMAYLCKQYYMAELNEEFGYFKNNSEGA